MEDKSFDSDTLTSVNELKNAAEVYNDIYEDFTTITETLKELAKNQNTSEQKRNEYAKLLEDNSSMLKKIFLFPITFFKLILFLKRKHSHSKLENNIHKHLGEQLKVLSQLNNLLEKITTNKD